MDPRKGMRSGEGPDLPIFPPPPPAGTGGFGGAQGSSQVLKPCLPEPRLFSYGVENQELPLPELCLQFACLTTACPAS